MNSRPSWVPVYGWLTATLLSLSIGAALIAALPLVGGALLLRGGLVNVSVGLIALGVGGLLLVMALLDHIVRIHLLRSEQEAKRAILSPEQAPQLHAALRERTGWAGRLFLAHQGPLSISWTGPWRPHPDLHIWPALLDLCSIDEIAALARWKLLEADHGLVRRLHTWLVDVYVCSRVKGDWQVMRPAWWCLTQRLDPALAQIDSADAWRALPHKLHALAARALLISLASMCWQRSLLTRWMVLDARGQIRQGKIAWMLDQQRATRDPVTTRTLERFAQRLIARDDSIFATLRDQPLDALLTPSAAPALALNKRAVNHAIDRLDRIDPAALEAERAAQLEYLRALEATPDDPYAASCLALERGELALSMGEQDGEALVEAYRAHVARWPEDWKHQLCLAAHLILWGDEAEGERLFEHILTHGQLTPEDYERVAEALELGGRDTLALRLHERFSAIF
jgi:hypothetical protein